MSSLNSIWKNTEKVPHNIKKNVARVIDFVLITIGNAGRRISAVQKS